MSRLFFTPPADDSFLFLLPFHFFHRSLVTDSSLYSHTVPSVVSFPSPASNRQLPKSPSFRTRFIYFFSPNRTVTFSRAFTPRPDGRRQRNRAGCRALEWMPARVSTGLRAASKALCWHPCWPAAADATASKMMDLKDLPISSFRH